MHRNFGVINGVAAMNASQILLMWHYVLPGGLPFCCGISLVQKKTEGCWNHTIVQEEVLAHDDMIFIGKSRRMIILGLWARTRCIIPVHHV